ncbi:MAG: putative DNA repair protein MutK [Halieaceae bacterium]|jgi:predicted DNA repair protein MutK
MAGASLLALLDDIALLMDDVSVMTKVAARKTAGVLGDDLAVNAEKVTGVPADRELPVVFAVFRGSMLNKVILVPAALLIAWFAEWLIAPLLMAGGLFLCYEGFEKVWHSLVHSKAEREAEHAALRKRLEDPATDPLELERKRIRGAIRTDFILSAEIIVITLGIVADSPLLVRASVLATIALVMTVGVYGLVAMIVKIDDLGLYLVQDERGGAFARLRRGLGRGLLAFAPRLMQGLTLVGTAAMFLVGGGILVHGAPVLHHASEQFTHWLLTATEGSALLGALSSQVFMMVVGFALGALTLCVLSVAGRLRMALSQGQ